MTRWEGGIGWGTRILTPDQRTMRFKAFWWPPVQFQMTNVAWLWAFSPLNLENRLFLFGWPGGGAWPKAFRAGWQY